MSANEENQRYYKTVKKKFNLNQIGETSGFRSTLMTRNMSGMISPTELNNTKTISSKK